jgi:hypothetical protein
LDLTLVKNQPKDRTTKNTKNTEKAELDWLVFPSCSSWFNLRSKLFLGEIGSAPIEPARHGKSKAGMRVTLLRAYVFSLFPSFDFSVSRGNTPLRKSSRRGRQVHARRMQI